MGLCLGASTVKVGRRGGWVRVGRAGRAGGRAGRAGRGRVGGALPGGRYCEGQGEKGERGGQGGGAFPRDWDCEGRGFWTHHPDHGMLMIISWEGTPVHVLMPGGMAHMLPGL